MHESSHQPSLRGPQYRSQCLTSIAGSVLSLAVTACSGATDASGPEEIGSSSEAIVVAPGSAVWVAQGPAPMRSGQAVTWPAADQNPVTGAIQALAPHPSNANILYAGTVNGGVWKTVNALAQNPTWTALTDRIESLSIGALAIDRTNANTIIAATGLWSSFGRSTSVPNDGVSQGQVMVSRDAGSTWSVYADPLFVGKKAGAAMVRGNTIVIGFLDALGLVRSTDLGAHWTRISGSGTGLPSGAIDDLTEDIQNARRLYLTSTGLGVFRSDDLGVSWVNISQNDTGDLGLDAQMRVNATAAKLSVSQDGRAYVAVVGLPTHNGTTFVNYVGYTQDGGSHWIAMDFPGVEARPKPWFHFSLAADRTNSSYVYLAGVSDPVRGRAWIPPGNGVQWESLEATTPHNTVPHVDARDLVIDANLDLLDASDGGVFRRVRPLQNTGDWVSLAGNMQDAEAYSVAYDPLSRVILAGLQDNGTVFQSTPNQLTWNTAVIDDGADVQVETISTPGFSVRYASGQQLMNFTRSVWDANNVQVSQANPLLITADGSFFQAQWMSPIALNPVNGKRIAIGASDAVWESYDQGDHITSLGAAPNASGLVYGPASNPDVIYAAAGQVFVRLSAGGPLAPTSPIANCQAKDIAVDPGNYRTAFTVCDTAVYYTADAGASWTEITGNLYFPNPIPSPGVLRSIRYLSGASNSYVAVSADRGVYVSAPGNLGAWTKVGSNLPIAPVMDMAYNKQQDILVVATLGRGAWSVTGLGGP